MKTSTLTCEEARTAWLLEDSGELEPGRGAALRQHLKVCAECRAERAEQGIIMDLVRDSGEVPEMPLGMLTRIRSTGQPRVIRLPRPAWWLATAAALLVALGATLWSRRDLTTTDHLASAALSESDVQALLDTELDDEIDSLRSDMADLIAETGDWLPEDDNSLARQLLAWEELSS